jgi:hypothetical protein
MGHGEAPPDPGALAGDDGDGDGAVAQAVAATADSRIGTAIVANDRAWLAGGTDRG